MAISVLFIVPYIQGKKCANRAIYVEMEHLLCESTILHTNVQRKLIDSYKVELICAQHKVIKVEELS